MLLFQESARLAAAFGLAVSGTMAVTSLAFYLVARIRFGWLATVAALVTGVPAIAKPVLDLLAAST